VENIWSLEEGECMWVQNNI